MSSKNKKRALLPARPESLSVDRVLEDLASAPPRDPVFSILQTPHPGTQGSEVTYQQGRRYLEVNQRLLEVRGHLGLQREGLHSAGEQLERTVNEVKGQGPSRALAWRPEASGGHLSVTLCGVREETAPQRLMHDVKMFHNTGGRGLPGALIPGDGEP
ncbi:unnamed protein product [Gadus morhua 'NCC']